MSRVVDNHAIPSAIKEKLSSIRIRASVVATVRAIAFAVAVLLVAMVAVMAVDWWFMLLSTAVRTTLSVCTLLTSVVALLLFSVLPISQALSWNVAARNVDREIPQMQERWVVRWRCSCCLWFQTGGKHRFCFKDFCIPRSTSPQLSWCLRVAT